MESKVIIKKPVYTEKATVLNEKRIFVFWVNPKASKIEIQNAIKKIYGANTESIRVVNTASKSRKGKKGDMIKRKEAKKAYITITKDSKLDLSKFSKAEKEVKVKIKSDAKAAKSTTPKTVKKTAKAATKKSQ